MNNEETIKVIGRSGTRSIISYEELATKKPNPKLDTYKNHYVIKLTEWYSYGEMFTDINYASSVLFKVTQKLYKISH